MAMTILNNSSTALSLGELNKNINKLGKTLTKVSTGQRIVRASDDAASFAISEKMREQIRSLEQDIQNVQNGSAMLRTAHGGIENIVDELRSLKELAINAANDSNTDEDRAIIQKEFDKRRDTIDDIATWTTYNTKPLLDGTYANSRLAYSVGAMNAAIAFSPGSPNCIEMGATSTGYGRGIIAQISFIGNGNEWENSPLTTLEDESDIDSDIETNIAVKMNFSKLSGVKDGYGFTILCGGCDQYINIKFNSSIDVDQSSVIRGINGEVNYVIGSAQINSGEELAKCIFEGVKLLNGIMGSENGMELVRLDERHDVNLLNINGNYYITKEESPSLCIYNGIIGEINLPSAPAKKDGEPLTIHHGFHANQQTNFYINDMHASSLVIDQVNIKTRQNAITAIAIIDDSIEYSLNEATRLGSYLQRLDYTEANVTTQNESVQNAESTIRDADMAKEMTEYTKQNVLTQAAQSMLAQANQNLSGVLSLLQ